MGLGDRGISAVWPAVGRGVGWLQSDYPLRVLVSLMVCGESEIDAKGSCAGNTAPPSVGAWWWRDLYTGDTP